jgi:hypothetical protein
MEFKPKKEKDKVSSQNPNNNEVIKAVFKSVNSKTKNKTIKLKLIAEKNGGKTVIKEA